MLARFEFDPTLQHPIRHAVLAVALVCLTLATAGYGYVTHPSNEQPPTVPSSPAFIVDLNVDSVMPAAWVVRTDLIEDGPNTWVVLSVEPDAFGHRVRFQHPGLRPAHRRHHVRLEG